jgi:eukaryotic-like serine/threonine-protein kinase
VLSESAERGERLQAIFGNAVALPADARGAYLDDACAGAHDLRREIDALLAADDAAEVSGFLHAPPVASAEADEEDAEQLAGAVVGPYTLERRIGRGGMGSVYLAVRDDVDKRVAVKVLDAPLVSAEASRRFLLERRVLARFDHPHIARLLDAGILPPATPYFVMELVEGEAITNYAAALDLDARLRLFEAVCSAVAYAHQHLVVHRDLKPSNIMVDRSGVVKLVDFGIAKLLDEDDELTGTGTRLMTPEFAAPEQVLGEPITPATDVYALGLLLFELLTGMRAYTLRGLTPAHAERLVCGWSPPKPSTVGARSAGDLDAICLRALEKDPSRRYPTGAELRADVHRYLERRPVEARPPALAYLARKFAARHRLAVVTVTLLVLVLLGGSLAVLRQARRANRERARAERALNESEAVGDFLVGLFEARDPARSRGSDPTASELMTRAEQRVETLADQPLVQARMLNTISDVYVSLGMYDRAEPLARRALRLREKHAPTDHPDVASSLHDLARIEYERGNFDEAGRHFQAALAMRRRVLGPDHPEVAETLSRYGLFLLRVPRDDRTAEPLLAEAVAITRRAFGNDDPRVAHALNVFAAVYDFRDDYDRAEVVLREALSIQRRRLGAAHPDALETLNNLGTTLMFRGELDAAEPVIREALELNRRVIGPNHPHVALNLGNLAAIHERRGQLAEAERMYREAVAIAEAALGARHARVGYLVSKHARVLAALGRVDEAEALFTRSLHLLRGGYGDRHALVVGVEKALDALRARTH